MHLQISSISNGAQFWFQTLRLLLKTVLGIEIIFSVMLNHKRIDWKATK